MIKKQYILLPSIEMTYAWYAVFAVKIQCKTAVLEWNMKGKICGGVALRA